MIDFIFWNLVLFVFVLIIIRSKDFTVIAVSYLITLWATLTWVVTQPFEVQGRRMNTTEYVNASNYTITDYNYEVYTIPQNFLDVTYVVALTVLALYAGRKLLLSKQGSQIRKKWRKWWL